MDNTTGVTETVTDTKGLAFVSQLIAQISTALGVALELFNFDEFDGVTYVSAIGPVGSGDPFDLDVRVDLTITGPLDSPSDVSATMVLLWDGDELPRRKPLYRNEKSQLWEWCAQEWCAP